jgi:hypothetical protein
MTAIPINTTMRAQISCQIVIKTINMEAAAFSKMYVRLNKEITISFLTAVKMSSFISGMSEHNTRAEWDERQSGLNVCISVLKRFP